MNTSLQRRFGAVLATCLLVTACGSGDGADPAVDDVRTTQSDAPSDTEAPAATGNAAPADDAGDDADADSRDGADGDTASAAFPVTIEHQFGETTIDADPQRIVSIGFAEHDGLLALGVEPIAVRDWYGDMPYATWPWAQDELGDLTPEVLPSTDLNFEQIAALDPDLIIGLSSGMSESDYETLAAIAPTVAQSDEFPEYATPWREQLRTTGLAVGKADEADEVIAEVEQMYVDAREANPEFADATATVGFAYQESPGAYASGDVRSQFLIELGFVIPPEYDELAGDEFYFNVSQEELATLDADVIVWLVSNETGYEQIRSMPLRPTLTAFAEGRELVADPLLSGAFSHASPLSIEYVLDELVPELAMALDGDPSTVVLSAELLEDGADGGTMAEDEAAAAEAWSEVFDSTVNFDTKATHLENAEALRPTIEAYEAAGSGMGGIMLVPNVVQVDGDNAVVTYDVLFGGETAYSALEGEMSLIDGEWVVARDEFCSFMASARTACTDE